MAGRGMNALLGLIVGGPFLKGGLAHFDVWIVIHDLALLS
jgi:hypothetical protein